MGSQRIIVSVLLLFLSGCSTTSQPPEAAKTPAASASPVSQPISSEVAAVKPRIDACALLTSEEIESVQGEALKETKLSGQSGGGFSVSQCFYTLPTSTNSISLSVTQKGEGVGAVDPKDYWRDTFHEDEDKGKDKDKDKDVHGTGDRDKKSDEEEEGAPPLKVSGVGDEAYWTGTSVGGTLYVLKGNAYLRISVGGPSAQTKQIKKATTLAQKVLRRL